MRSNADCSPARSHARAHTRRQAQAVLSREIARQNRTFCRSTGNRNASSASSSKRQAAMGEDSFRDHAPALPEPRTYIPRHLHSLASLQPAAAPVTSMRVQVLKVSAFRVFPVCARTTTSAQKRLINQHPFNPTSHSPEKPPRLAPSVPPRSSLLVPPRRDLEPSAPVPSRMDPFFSHCCRTQFPVLGYIAKISSSDLSRHLGV